MKRVKLLAVLPVLLLAGCATFPLGTVHAQAGRTADEQQLDILVCKDQAHTKASGAGPQVTGFLLSATLIGAPLGVKMDQQIQRSEFKSCMAAKGYTVS